VDEIALHSQKGNHQKPRRPHYRQGAQRHSLNRFVTRFPDERLQGKTNKNRKE
jgi:hypothetical protein